mgnify:CR=1
MDEPQREPESPRYFSPFVFLIAVHISEVFRNVIFDNRGPPFVAELKSKLKG